MSGSYSDFYNPSPLASGSPWSPIDFYASTGAVALHGVSHEYGSVDADALWERMYIKPKPVIIMCGFCKSHNAVTNPTCVQCGAPMGYGIERIYG